MTKPQLDAKSVGATLALGSIGLISLGAQPLLYGIYVKEAVIGEAQLGLLSSIEVLGIALASSITISAVKHLPLRLMALGGLLLLGLGNAVMLAAHEALLAMGKRAGVVQDLMVSARDWPEVGTAEYKTVMQSVYGPKAPASK